MIARRALGRVATGRTWPYGRRGCRSKCSPTLCVPGAGSAKRRLERAREQLDFADEINVHWRGFQLDPGSPVEPRPASLAGEAGLDVDDAVAVLEAGAFANEVRADLAEAVENDVLGVPAFLLAPGFAIPGAQEVETLKMMLTRMHDRPS